MSKLEDILGKVEASVHYHKELGEIKGADAKYDGYMDRVKSQAKQQIKDLFKDLFKELVEPYHKPECNYWPITDSIGRRGVTVSGGNCDCGLEESIDEL